MPDLSGRSQSLASVPFVGHVCPNADDLRPGVDDLCDLPEPWRRLAYTLNIDSQHDCTAGFGHHSDFCKHAVWREVVAERRVAASRASTAPLTGGSGTESGSAPTHNAPSRGSM